MKRYIIRWFFGLGILFICQSCWREEKEKTAFLCKELQNTALSAPAFDSLINGANVLSKYFRAKVLFVAGSRYSMRTDQMMRAKRYLNESMKLAPRDLKNKVTLALARLYGLLIVRGDSAEEAIRFMTEARSKVVFTREEEAEFYYLQAKFFKSVNLERAFEAVDQALFMYRNLCDTRGEMETCCLKATFYGILEDYQQQYDCYEEAYRLFKKKRDGDVPPFSEQMAACLKKLGRYEEALLWYDEVLKTLSDTSDTSDTSEMGRYGVQVAEAYSGLGYHEKARGILKQGLAVEKRGGLRNVFLGRIANSFLVEGMRDSALVYFDRAIQFYAHYAQLHDLKVPGVMFMNHLQYARCLWDSEKRDAALGHLEYAGRLVAEIPESLKSQAKVLEQLCEYYEVLDEKPKYCDAYRRHDSVVEMYQTFRLDNRYRSVLQKYRNQKMLQEIESMNQKREAINWWLILSLMMTVGMLAGALVYVWVSWRKQIMADSRHE